MVVSLERLFHARDCHGELRTQALAFIMIYVFNSYETILAMNMGIYLLYSCIITM